MKDYGLLKNNQKGLFSRIRDSTAPYVLAVSAMSGAACGGGNPNGPGPVPSSNPTNLNVRGVITDRINNEPVNGCNITYTGKSGQGVKTAVSANGNYSMENVPRGRYEVKIEGCNNVPHMNMDYNLVAEDNPFSVLRAETGFDTRYENFFNHLARNPEWSQGKMKKWSAMPREILVDQTSLNTLPQEDQNEFMAILNEINQESIPDMFCGKTGPLPIRVEPYANNFKDGSILIKFYDQQSTAPRRIVDDNIIAATAMLRIGMYTTTNNRDERKHNTAHELFHDAFADHAYDHGYSNGLMDGNNRVVTLSRQEELGACLVYGGDMHPGNVPRDTNVR